MNLKFIFLAVLLTNCLCAATDPAVAVVLMVKNEAPVICQTLQPLVTGGITHFLVFDTGSTDGTQKLVRELFKKHPECILHLIEEPFVDFSTSRNRALEHAEKLFPTIPFVVMPDAEWYLKNTAELVAFCQKQRSSFHPCCMISVHLIHPNNGDHVSLDYQVGRIIRQHKNVRFVGVVHEELNLIGTSTAPQSVYFEWRQTELGNTKSAQRCHQDKDLLLKSLQKDPHNPRTLFYLGQTYACLGDWHNAYKFYTQRAAIKGWDEEDFITFLRLGDAAEHLEAKENPQEEPVAVTHYLHASSLRPHRAEPFVKLASYYLQKNMMRHAFYYAQKAIAIPYPKNDILFVDHNAYNLTRYDVLGVSAWYVGAYKLGQWATEKALEADPNNKRLLTNLEFYHARSRVLALEAQQQSPPFLLHAKKAATALQTYLKSPSVGIFLPIPDQLWKGITQGLLIFL